MIAKRRILENSREDRIEKEKGVCWHLTTVYCVIF